MNEAANRDIFHSDTSASETEKTHFPLGYGVRIFILAAIGALCAVLFIYLPILPAGISAGLTESAKAYAAGFNFDRTAHGFARTVSILSSDELWCSLFLLVSPAIVFGKRLIWVSVPIRAFFTSLGAASVLTAADAGTYASAAVISASLASVIAFSYAADASLRFCDLIGISAENGFFVSASAFILKILSALGFYVTALILILLPSAFI